VRSRRRLFSTARVIHSGELPRLLRSSGPPGIWLWNFDTSTTSSRRPFSARPRISSDSPNAYTSAVSMKLTPAFSAVAAMRWHSASSVLPQAPTIIVPRQSSLTSTPVPPRIR
jgi:hypothetical protein